MLKKHLILIAIFATNIVFPSTQVEKLQFFCSVNRLKDLEYAKFLELVKQGNSSAVEYQVKINNLNDGIDHGSNLLMRLIVFYSKYEDAVDGIDNALDDQDAKKLKKAFVKISQQIHKEKTLTSLIKNLIAVACVHSPELLLAIEKMIFYDDSSDMELYLPNNIDIVQIVMEQIYASNQYYIQKIKAKQSITIDDFCYVLQQFGVALQLPVKSLHIWNDTIKAVQQGVKDLPQDVRKECSIFNDLLNQADLEAVCQALGAMINVRKEIVADNGADDVKIKAYAQLIDNYFALTKKISDRYMKNIVSVDLVKWIRIAERIIFTK